MTTQTLDRLELSLSDLTFREQRFQFYKRQGVPSATAMAMAEQDVTIKQDTDYKLLWENYQTFLKTGKWVVINTRDEYGGL